MIVTIDPIYWIGLDRSALARVQRGERRQDYLSPNVPYGWIDFPPSVNRLIGVWWPGRCSIPRFPEDLRPIVREFYGLFYHRAERAAVERARGRMRRADE